MEHKRILPLTLTFRWGRDVPTLYLVRRFLPGARSSPGSTHATGIPWFSFRRLVVLELIELGDLPGIAFQPEAPWGEHTRWLTCMTIDPWAFGADREIVRHALAAAEIESRPLWKPMHLQPVFAECEHVGGAVSEVQIQVEARVAVPSAGDAICAGGLLQRPHIGGG